MLCVAEDTQSTQMDRDVLSAFSHKTIFGPVSYSLYNCSLVPLDVIFHWQQLPLIKDNKIKIKVR